MFERFYLQLRHANGDQRNRYGHMSHMCSCQPGELSPTFFREGGWNLAFHCNTSRLFFAVLFLRYNVDATDGRTDGLQCVMRPLPPGRTHAMLYYRPILIWADVWRRQNSANQLMRLRSACQQTNIITAQRLWNGGGLSFLNSTEIAL